MKMRWMWPRRVCFSQNTWRIMKSRLPSQILSLISLSDVLSQFNGLDDMNRSGGLFFTKCSNKRIMNSRLLSQILSKISLIFLVNQLDWMRWMKLVFVFHKSFLTQGFWWVIYYHKYVLSLIKLIFLVR